MWAIIVRFISSLGRDWVVKPISTLISVSFMWAFHSLRALFPSEAAKLQGLIIDTYYMPPAEWAGFVSRFMERLTGAKINIETITKEGFGAGSRASMEAMGETFLKPMLGLIMPTPAEIEVDPMGGAERFMSANLQFQMSAWLLHVIGDMQSFGMFKSLKDLPNAISWSFGIGWLSWLVMGPPFRKGIAEPMEKMFNRMYAPEVLTAGQAIEATKKGRYTPDEYIREMMDRGYSPRRASILYELAERDLSDGAMKRLVELNWMDFMDVEQELIRRGYEDSRAMVLARLIVDDRKISLIEDIVKEAEGRFEDEILDETIFRRYLGSIGMSPEEQDLAIDKVFLRKRRRRWLTPAQVMAALKKGKLGTIEVRNYLLKLGYTPKDADLYMELEK